MKNKKKKEFSKILLVQESILVWIVTLGFLVLAGFAILKGHMGDFPWLTATAALPWTTYAVSQAFYYNKAKEENKIKIQQCPQCEQQDNNNCQ